jgi:hypothetical protein
VLLARFIGKGLIMRKVYLAFGSWDNKKKRYVKQKNKLHANAFNKY